MPPTAGVVVVEVVVVAGGAAGVIVDVAAAGLWLARLGKAKLVGDRGSPMTVSPSSSIFAPV